jgi:hypothetical protein
MAGTFHYTDKMAYTSIDEILGPRHSRYFGDGFKGVRRSLCGFDFDADTRTLHAKATVAYPEKWSTKKQGKLLTPHLSTLDAMYLHSCLGEWLLFACFDVDGSPTPFNLRRIEVKAGTLPQEDLSCIPISISIENTERTTNEFCRYRSTIVARIGSMAVSSEFEHNGIERENRQLGIPPLFDAASAFPLTRECQLSMRTDRAQQLERIRIDSSNRKIGANFEIRSQEQYQPEFITPIEAVAAIAQLAQVLIYRMDGLDRSQTDTLWMRHILYESIGHDRPTETRSADAWIDSDKSIQKAGQHWRVYRVLGRLGASRGTCSITHRLPSASHDLATAEEYHGRS